MTSPTPPEVSAAIAWLESVAGNEGGMYAEDCANTIRAHIATLEARLAEAGRDAEIGRVVWRYIDRMNDVAPEAGDPAEKILAEFVASVEPLILAAIAKDQP